jgi:hypothetical protein
MTPLEELRALVHVRGVLEAEIEDAVRRALDAGVDRSSVAFVLGISRASLYRHFGVILMPTSTETASDAA